MHRINCKVRGIKEAPGPSVSEGIADIFRNYNIDVLVCISLQIDCNIFELVLMCDRLVWIVLCIDCFWFTYV